MIRGRTIRVAEQGNHRILGPAETSGVRNMSQPATSNGPEAADHSRILQAIRYLERTQLQQPTLTDVAEELSISPGHLQRVFTRWVGVSPKRYLQHLTLGQARQLLRERFTVLDTTFDCGLSSPGRLHDLFVTWEAMTPGQFAARGEGLDIRYGWFDSPFGEALSMGTERGLCGLAFCEDVGRDAALTDMTGRWPKAGFVEDSRAVESWTKAAFDGGKARLAMMGTPFQIKVWEALLTIPSGRVTTYGEIARSVGSPKAVRAVGTAVGRNPVSWLIPCHRALRSSGGLGGYHWGLDTKRAMLAWEAIRADAA